MRYLKQDLVFLREKLHTNYPDLASQIVGELDEFSEILRLPPWRSVNSIRKYLGLEIPFVGSLIPKIPMVADGSHIEKVKSCSTIDFDDEVWVYINGVMVDREMLRIQGNWLARIIGKKVLLLHNPTDGLGLDLFESFLGRNFAIDGLPVSWMTKVLEEVFNCFGAKKINIVAHSQGCIILGECLRRLEKDFPKILKSLNIFTFASPAKSLPKVGFAEHYANKNDLVAQLGVLHSDVPYEGKVHVRDARGHWFNTHYLSALLNGDFGQTKLYQLVKARAPQTKLDLVSA